MRGKKKHETIKDLVKKQKPSIFLLHETKMDVGDSLNHLVQIWKQSQGVVVSARGAS